jgi:hypothetical protein
MKAFSIRCGRCNKRAGRRLEFDLEYDCARRTADHGELQCECDLGHRLQCNASAWEKRDIRTAQRGPVSECRGLYTALPFRRHSRRTHCSPRTAIWMYSPDWPCRFGRQPHTGCRTRIRQARPLDFQGFPFRRALPSAVPLGMLQHF